MSRAAARGKFGADRPVVRGCNAFVGEILAQVCKLTMPGVKRDQDQILSQPYPPFLEQLETDPEAAMAEFERCARRWLRSHPSASMQSLTAAEQQDVIDETIQRCLAKDGEPLKNYTDMWGSFGTWLTSVAERTCSANFRTRAAKPKPRREEGQKPAETATETYGGSPGRKTTDLPPRQDSAVKRLAPAPPSLRTIFALLRSPRVLIPVAILSVFVAFRAFQTSSNSPHRGQATTGPIEIALLSGDEIRNSQYDVLALDNYPGGEDAEVPMTAVFRSGRLTVLQMAPEAPTEDSYPSRVIVVNKEGAVAWEAPIDLESMSEGSLNLRIDPRTIIADEYTIQVTDLSGAVVFKSAFTVVAQ
jgi:DNA-directed RNA polymerase specialized sigma24 family protein